MWRTWWTETVGTCDCGGAFKSCCNKTVVGGRERLEGKVAGEEWALKWAILRLEAKDGGAWGDPTGMAAEDEAGDNGEPGVVDEGEKLCWSREDSLEWEMDLGSGGTKNDGGRFLCLRGTCLSGLFALEMATRKSSSKSCWVSCWIRTAEEEDETPEESDWVSIEFILQTCCLFLTNKSWCKLVYRLWHDIWLTLYIIKWLTQVVS